MVIIDRENSRPNRRLKILISLFMIFTLTTSLVIIQFQQQQESNGTLSEPPVPARIVYTSHAPIFIDGNDEFTNASGVSWGSGTASDPYILEGWNISASYEQGIYIRNSDVYFIIRDCYVHNNFGISLSNCCNGILENNSCSGNYIGIYLRESSNNTLINNKCSNNGQGIVFWSSCDNNTLINNNCSSNNYWGINFFSSNNNSLIHNQLYDNIRHGIYIDERSSNNRIWNNTFYHNNDASDTYNPLHIQAHDQGYNNWWNSTEGYGNYWSDWTMPDNDLNGIVDNPYSISGNAGAEDYYPLTQPTHPLPVRIIENPILYVAIGAIIIAAIIAMALLMKNKKAFSLEKSPISSRKNGWTRKIAEKWRINFFCLIGVSIGIFSLFLIWEDTYLLGLTGWNYSYSVTAFEGHLWLFGILVLLSTIISIITPLGGCVQFWLVGYYLFMELSGSSILEMKTYLGLGPWLALFSAIIVLFSMIIPLGIGFNKLPLKLKERLLTFSRIKSQS